MCNEENCKNPRNFEVLEWFPMEGQLVCLMYCCAFVLPNTFWDSFLIPIRPDRRAVTSKGVLLQLCRNCRNPSHAPRNPSHISSSQEGGWKDKEKVKTGICAEISLLEKFRAVCSISQFTQTEWQQFRLPLAGNQCVPKNFIFQLLENGKTQYFDVLCLDWVSIDQKIVLCLLCRHSALFVIQVHSWETGDSSCSGLILNFQLNPHLNHTHKIQPACLKALGH